MTTQKLALFPLLILTLLLTSGLTTAQEQSGYDIALERIEAARGTGATELDLSGLGLEALPLELFQLDSLTTLDLYGNQLRQLPLEIGQLNNLTTLWLANNQLTSLPPEIGQLHSLIWLNVGGNQLTHMPPEIGQLSRLIGLFIYRNELTSMPLEIGHLSKLCGLDLGYNMFRHLPTVLDDLPSMTMESCWIDVQGNPLITPPENVVVQGTPAILDYLRNQMAIQAQQITLAIAGMIGLIVAFFLAFRWKTRRPGRKKKRDI